MGLGLGLELGATYDAGQKVTTTHESTRSHECAMRSSLPRNRMFQCPLYPSGLTTALVRVMVRVRARGRARGRVRVGVEAGLGLGLGLGLRFGLGLTCGR